MLLSQREKVSRRTLFTVPPISYLTTPSIDRARCAALEGCEQCVAVCPHSAIAKDGDRLLVDRNSCRSCGLCVTACPRRAVEFPGWSPEELEAQVSTILNSDLGSDTRAVALICAGTPLPPGPGWLPVKVPCLSMVSAGFILGCLANGINAIGLRGCGDRCTQALDAKISGWVDYCGKLLRLLGDPWGRQRVQLLNGTGRGDSEFAPELPPLAGTSLSGPVVLFGPGVAGQAILNLAERFNVREFSLEHPESPLGRVQVEPASCTVCGLCAEACTTGALTYGRQGDSVTLSLDAALCTGCKRCVAVCPEESSGAIALTPITELGRLQQGRMALCTDIESMCEKCGAPVASSAMLSRITALLGEGEAPLASAISRYCSSCRGFL